MHKYIIEREIPGVGQMDEAALEAAANRSRRALEELGTAVQWRESYVTDDKVYCVYIASSADLVKKHAELSGFPAQRISEVRAVIDPATPRH
jgi:hypothetical protein